MTVGFSTAVRNARADAITTQAGGSCKLRIYNGTRPATGGTATTLLAELTCNATFAPGASGGVLTLNAITQDSSADATGTATWARIVKSDGTTHILDCSVGTSAADIILNTTSIVAGAAVAVTSAVLTEGNA
jgi:pseudouridine-5'-phosphate glycosidase